MHVQVDPNSIMYICIATNEQDKEGTTKNEEKRYVQMIGGGLIHGMTAMGCSVGMIQM